MDKATYNLKKCPTCKTRKKVLGMGMVEKTCYTCDGNGWVEVITHPAENEPAVEAPQIFEEAHVPAPIKKAKKKPSKPATRGNVSKTKAVLPTLPE